MQIGDKVQIKKQQISESIVIEKVSVNSEITDITDTHYFITKTIVVKIKKEDEALIEVVTIP